MDIEQPASFDFVESVLRCVEAIEPGRVKTYGLIADELGRGGPRQVARVLSRAGHGVPWWRVVRSDGTLPPHLQEQAMPLWTAEGTPLRGRSVDVRRAVSGI